MSERSPIPGARPGAVAALAALVVVLSVILLTADRPLETLETFVLGPFSNRFVFGNLLARAALLSLTGLGVVIAFRAGVFNLGGEGQVYLAALVTTALITDAGSSAVMGIWGAAAVSAALAGASGWLKHRTGADELITSFLISAAIMPVVDYLITGPMRDRASSLLATVSVPDELLPATLLPPSNLTTVGLWGPVAIAVGATLLFLTRFGYELRVVGANRRLARTAAIPLGRYTWMPMLLSGMLHGLAGAGLVLGIHGRSILGFSSGLGWNGLAVALIARNHPLLVIPSALFFAFLEAGSRAAVLQNRSTWELGSIVQAVVFLFVTARIVRGAGRRRA